MSVGLHIHSVNYISIASSFHLSRFLVFCRLNILLDFDEIYTLALNIILKILTWYLNGFRVKQSNMSVYHIMQSFMQLNSYSFHRLFFTNAYIIRKKIYISSCLMTLDMPRLICYALFHFNLFCVWYIKRSCLGNFYTFTKNIRMNHTK